MMHHHRLRARIAICMIAFMGGCTAHRGGQNAPTTAPTTEPASDIAGILEPPPPPPVRPGEALAYLDGLLADETRLVEVYTHETERGGLDDYGRKKLRAALKQWWKTAELDKRSRSRQVWIDPTKQADANSPARMNPADEAKFFYLPLTSEMGIRIYGPGSATARSPGQAVMNMQIFKQRGVAKVSISDADNERLSGPVYILPTPEPVAWVDKLFSGKL
jgi:hypothetical protein